MDTNKTVFNHNPVMLNECIKGLNIKSGGVYIDGTIGGAGHSLRIAERLSNGMLIGIDQDMTAVRVACDTLSAYMDISTVVHGNFSEMTSIAEKLEVTGADGILLDLGVSSYQIDTPERGFSYMEDAELDMRMNYKNKLTAYDVVNEYDEDEITSILYKYGEEKWAKRISEFIVAARNESPIKTTLELVSVIKAAIPKGARSDGSHPAKRTFQAIRIEVNNELDMLEKALKDMVGLLNPGGRICVITFHSLEDRIVKNVFNELESPCKCPRDFPVCVCGGKQTLKVITKKPIEPDKNEILNNKRSKSAKLRIAEKI